MQKSLFIFCVAAALLMTSCSETKKSPGAVKGILDLTEYNPAGNKLYTLNGQWEFYWDRLLTPEQIHSEKSLQKEYITVPSTWKGYRDKGTALPRYGCATYRLIIRTRLRGTLYLYFTVPNAASTIWINEKETARYGKVSIDREHERPTVGKKICKFINPDKEIEIIIQVSNFYKFGPGITHPVTLGKREAVYSSKNHSTALDVFILAFLFLISLYHLSLYFFRRSEKGSLFFATFSFTYALRTITTNEIFILDLFPAIPWEIVYRTDFLTIALIVPLFIKFISFNYREQMSLTLNRIFYGAGAIYSVMVLVLPPYIFSQYLFFYHTIMFTGGIYLVYVIIAALLKKKRGALVTLIGFIMIFVTGTYDLLVAHEIINSIFISPFGIMGFFVTQALNISYRFSKAYAKVESFTTILEKEVELRTNELEEERNILSEWNENFKDELDMAKKIQQKLIPHTSPARNISFLYMPMEKVGGDFIDFLRFRNSDKTGIFISDVSGHGVPAAFITSMIKTSILQAGTRREDPAELMSYLNGILLDYTADNFVTAMYAIYDPDENSITYSIAGHNLPIGISADTASPLKLSKTIALAIMDNNFLGSRNKQYTNNKLSLKSYDKILFYTDGLTEATPVTDNNIYFEDNILGEAINVHRKLPGKVFLEKLTTELIQFRGSNEFDDDVCMICIDVTSG